jgi:transposase-like protein
MQRASRDANDVSRANGPLETEDRSRELLERLRWPDGVRCPRCDALTGISRIRRRGQFECDACGYQFSVRVGTVLQGSRLPLSTWVLAVRLMTETDHGVSANRLAPMLGVSYKTAWFLSHRIRLAMRDEARALIAAGPLGDGVPQQLMRVLRRSVVDTHRRLDTRHLPAYLDEAAFRLANPSHESRFTETLVRLLRAGTVSYSELTGPR